MKKVVLILAAITAVIIGTFVACDKNSKKIDIAGVSVVGVVLSEKTVVLEVGDSTTLRATVSPNDATEKGISWKSSDESIITVNNGVVKGIANGKATITVTTKDGNKTATCEVDVIVKMKTLHNFVVDDIYGNPFDFSQLKGKKILIVNVASMCGYTPHYSQLQDLYANYAASNFVVIGFPCNDFGGQEPGNNKTILEFCESTYGVTFPLMSKVRIKGNKSPIYKWLTEKSENGVMDIDVQWNFQKIMINENGQIVDYISYNLPFYDKIVMWITSN